MAKRTEEEFFTAVSDLSYELPDLEVGVFGDVAIASFLLDYTVTMADTTFIVKDRSTLVLVKDKDKWKIAHEHFSPFLEAENE